MVPKTWRFAPLLFVALGACATAPKTTEEGYLTELPEEVLALAAPYQDLSAVRLDPADGCYWYLHRNAVEDTFLPLRTAGGNPICTRLATEEEIAAANAAEAQ